MKLEKYNIQIKGNQYIFFDEIHGECTSPGISPGDDSLQIVEVNEDEDDGVVHAMADNGIP